MENKVKTQIGRIYLALNKLDGAMGEAKKHLIGECLSSDLASRALRYLLDPGMVFHIGEKSLNKVDGDGADPFDDFFVMCDTLSSAQGVSHEIVARVNATINGLENYLLEVFAKQFLCKTLRIGVTSKTVNKIAGYEFIPEFRCMLANKYFDHPDKVDGKEFYLTEKLDGIRCVAIVTPNSTKLFTRQGQPIEGLDDIEAELGAESCWRNTPFVVDGELLISNRDGIPSKDQYKATTMIVRRDGIKTGITYNVFDVLDYDDFMKRECKQPYSERRERLDQMFEGMDFVKVVQVLYCGNNTDRIIDHLNIQRGLNHEGVMVNLADEPYQFTRTNALLKVKVMQDADLLITGVQEGTGKYKGKLGSLIVDYKGTPVGVGSGLSDELREEIWDNQHKYVGRVAKIQYFEETHGEDGLPSIRFPVFIELREVEKEVSYN